MLGSQLQGITPDLRSESLVFSYHPLKHLHGSKIKTLSKIRKDFWGKCRSLGASGWREIERHFTPMCLEEKESLRTSISGTIIPNRGTRNSPSFSSVSKAQRSVFNLSVVANLFFPGSLCKLREDGCIFYEFWIYFYLATVPLWPAFIFLPMTLTFWFILLLLAAGLTCALHVVSLWSDSRAPCHRFFGQGPHEFSWGHLLDLSDWFLTFLLCLFLQLSSRSWRLDMNGRLDAVKPF